jgi:predicted HTH domain antitoxin
MNLLLEIPDHVAEAIRVPPMDRERQVLLELALALYARGLLSFGKARELARSSKLEFGMLLGERGIHRHYDSENLEEDIRYARGE